MGKLIDLTGKQFGRWTVVEYYGKNKSYNSIWKCKCTCGNEKIVIGSNLVRSKTLSCGCLAKENPSHNFIDLTNKVFGRLTVIKLAKIETGRTMWLCKCECGEEKEILATNLKRGLTTSCGCFKIEATIEMNTTHGESKSTEYTIWTNMIQRCTNPKSTAFNDYGGRGITVCERWKKFHNFLEDMGKRPSLKHSIERVDNELGYSPRNCKWATAEEQARNKRFVKNKTGYRGVYHQKKKGTWQASIRVGGKNISLGYFKDPEEASKARLEGELKYWNKSS